MVKAVKGVMSVQTGQFLRSKRLRKRSHMLPRGIIQFFFRQTLQQ
ncbi:Uncharacterised protein [Mycobacteroides abscessus subsp. massiliense]|nr:Uncharacterised protein [Mycobacteroides abscessus subsp. massiliense]